MRLHSFAVESYRSLRKLAVDLGELSVFVGDNGAGKTNLYRALELLQAAALGNLARNLAQEGGMASALWAGRRNSKEPARIILSARLGEGGRFDYSVEIGLKTPVTAAFDFEPLVKEERLSFRHRRTEVLFERKNTHVKARDGDGVQQDIELDLLPSETVLATMRDGARFPDADAVRSAFGAWRFYHGFRTDLDAPMRAPCLAVTTPTLASGGADLAALFATLAHIREDTSDLDHAVDDAFPGARLIVPTPTGTASFRLAYAEFPEREFEAYELSDGTLRYLALCGALLGYRLPPFLALNEPETSLHPSLLPPLARLIARAAERTQVLVVTHSQILADALSTVTGAQARLVVKHNGETTLAREDDDDDED